MGPLTDIQQKILNFIQERKANGDTPTFREIADHFGFRSKTAAVDHVHALERKGALKFQAQRARSFQIVSSANNPTRMPIMDIPIYGVIPAGFADSQNQEIQGCISADINTLGLKPTARTFALRVRGDSMIGKHILDGDYVILEHGVTPKNGDVVAALIDNESTLKTYMKEKGAKQCYLKAENPKYPKLIPANELVIQGVMVALIRK